MLKDIFEEQHEKSKEFSKKVILKKEDVEDLELEPEVAVAEKDPYSIENLGWGIMSYFWLLDLLAKLFSVLSVFAIILAVLYKNSGNLELHHASYLSHFTLGNIGGASTRCI